jgi:hypothetical protein
MNVEERKKTFISIIYWFILWSVVLHLSEVVEIIILKKKKIRRQHFKSMQTINIIDKLKSLLFFSSLFITVVYILLKYFCVILYIYKDKLFFFHLNYFKFSFITTFIDWVRRTHVNKMKIKVIKIIFTCNLDIEINLFFQKS